MPLSVGQLPAPNMQVRPGSGKCGPLGVRQPPVFTKDIDLDVLYEYPAQCV
jgi:hypothetical protein